MTERGKKRKRTNIAESRKRLKEPKIVLDNFRFVHDPREFRALVNELKLWERRK